GDLAIAVASVAAERVVGGALLARVADDEIVQARAPAHDVLGRRFEPFGKRMADEQEAALVVDRIEPDRRVLEEVDELLLLLADDLLHLAARGGVVDAQHDRARESGQWRRLDVAPLDP